MSAASPSGSGAAFGTLRRARRSGGRSISMDPTRNRRRIAGTPSETSLRSTSVESMESSFDQTCVATNTSSSPFSRRRGTVRSAMRAPTARTHSSRAKGGFCRANRASPERSRMVSRFSGAERDRRRRARPLNARPRAAAARATCRGRPGRRWRRACRPRRRARTPRRTGGRREPRGGPPRCRPRRRTR